VLSELPGLLISAEIEGVPVNFSEVLLSRDCADLEPALAEHLHRPIRALAESDKNDSGLDLLPRAWQHEARRRERGEKLKQQFLLGAVIYLVLLAAAFITLALYKKKVQSIQTEVAKQSPKYAVINQQQARWEIFAPAVEKTRYAVEVMFQLWKNWKDVPDLQFTSFHFTPNEWVLKGEGTLDLHYKFFTEGVKKNHDLTNYYDMESPYQPMKENRISFTVTGKPKLSALSKTR
jgi:hypothetical protein